MKFSALRNWHLATVLGNSNFEFKNFEFNWVFLIGFDQLINYCLEFF